MSNTIKIKRSQVTATPPSLGEGELAYSENSNTLFIGTSGNNVTAIGGTEALSGSFKYIEVSGQSTVVADNTSDTLTLIAGSNITISTNAGNDSITITPTGLIQSSYLDTDGTLSANSDLKIATQKAVKTYADNLISAANGTVYKGVIDASTNPNYPAADTGDLYRISVSGRVGGVSGEVVEAGDMIICLSDSTASGDQATVGLYWNAIQSNIDGAVVGPVSSTDGNVAFFDGTTGKIIKDLSITLSGSNTGDITLANTNYLSLSGQELTGGTVPVGSGGTGVVTLTSNGIIYGNGTSSVGVTAMGTWDAVNGVGQILSVNSGNVPVWTNTIDGGSF